jgi:predicted DNA-binding protein with PD1-like motif
MPSEGGAALHFHATLGTPTGAVIGGHLFGATCFSTVEIVFAEIKGCPVMKKASPVTGLAEFVLRV